MMVLEKQRGGTKGGECEKWSSTCAGGLSGAWTFIYGGCSGGRRRQLAAAVTQATGCMQHNTHPSDHRWSDERDSFLTKSQYAKCAPAV
jgi:hypothetical protein